MFQKRNFPLLRLLSAEGDVDVLAMGNALPLHYPVLPFLGDSSSHTLYPFHRDVHDLRYT